MSVLPQDEPLLNVEGGAAKPEAAPAEAAAAPAAASAAEVRVTELEIEVNRLRDQALRALADAENTRRRAQREIEDNSRYAVANLARDLLPVADNLRRALDSVPANDRAGDQRLEGICAGVELTERELLAVFERFAIKRVDPLGQPFDHNLHQAMFEIETAEYPPGTVAHVLQPGYVIHGRLLRPAMVGVAKAQAGSAPPKSGGPGTIVDQAV